MAYSQSTMVKIGNGEPRASFNVYIYKTDDILTVVTTAEYFAINPRFTFQPKDLILAQCGDAYAPLDVVDDSSAIVA